MLAAGRKNYRYRKATSKNPEVYWKPQYKVENCRKIIGPESTLKKTIRDYKTQNNNCERKIGNNSNERQQ